MQKRQKNNMISHYQRELAKMMSDQDFTRYLGGSVENKIIKYADLKNYNNINQLLPNDNDYCVILIESEKNSGHWTCLTRRGDTITEFDSYGDGDLDHELKFIPKQMQMCLGEKPNEMRDLLKTRGKGIKLIQNKMKLQSKGDPSSGVDVNTCGKHCISYILASRMGYTLPEYQELVKREMEKEGKPSDIVVCDWIK